MAIYDAATEAIFLCYLVDQEENDGDVRPYYASPTLQRYMVALRPSYQLPAASPEEAQGLSPDSSRSGSHDTTRVAVAATATVAAEEGRPLKEEAKLE